jgi:N-formylmethionyl-tRNA deformylase
MKNHLLFLFAAICVLASCSPKVSMTITKEEAEFINSSPDVMRILSVDNPEDLKILRHETYYFNVPDINSPEYRTLTIKLVNTLEACGEGAVGLAAPQVGVSRNLIAVKRLDKEGEPIEVYPDIEIEEVRGEMEAGSEGCLSVPDKKGNVMRYRDITIRYVDVNSDRIDQPRYIREDISGFTAVIFQHEIDHLNGIIYTDKLVETAPAN